MNINRKNKEESIHNRFGEKASSVNTYQEMVGGGELKALQFMMMSTPNTTGYS